MKGRQTGSSAKDGERFQDLFAGFFLGEALVAGLAGVLLVGAFLAADLAFAGALVPVAVFFATPRLDAVVVFFAEVGFALPARVFFGAAAFLVAAAAGFARLAVVDFFVITGFAAGALDLAAVAFVVPDLVALAAGLAFVAGLFSFAAEVSADLALGASFTRPEGPFGRTKTPFSVPDPSAFESCVFCAAPISSLYLVSTYFLI